MRNNLIKEEDAKLMIVSGDFNDRTGNKKCMGGCEENNWRNEVQFGKCTSREPLRIIKVKQMDIVNRNVIRDEDRKEDALLSNND